MDKIESTSLEGHKVHYFVEDQIPSCGIEEDEEEWVTDDWMYVTCPKCLKKLVRH